MGENESGGISRGQWMALSAALLGWMFDGLEMGLFPLVARPALQDLLNLTDDRVIGRWIAVATAGFLVGAATGGVVFGWLGDRIGRVRAMTLSVFTYALFSGLCGLATSVEQVAGLRFLSALGMGGEWSLGVALVMEVWPNRSRALLAGLIGAAANVGYLIIGLFGLALAQVLGQANGWLLSLGLPDEWAAALTRHQGWRLLMLMGAMPAMLTFFIRLFVPESSRWEQEKARGTTSNWAARDLLGVLVGAIGAGAIIYLWAENFPLAVRIAGSIAGLAVVTVGYLFPVVRYLQRLGGVERDSWVPTVRRMLLGALLGGIPLLGTWAAVQWIPAWADQLTGGTMPEAKANTQMASAFGAILGTIVAALMGDWFGRRLTYTLLCAGSLATVLGLFQLNTHYGPGLIAWAFVAGGVSASFYGWLPLYLPELFRTGMRATGQGFSFNFGRILAAVGVLQTGNLMGLFEGGYPQACSVMSLIYVVGIVVIWLAPETRGQPLPE